jgi:hypothetical protein
MFNRVSAETSCATPLALSEGENSALLLILNSPGSIRRMYRP